MPPLLDVRAKLLLLFSLLIFQNSNFVYRTTACSSNYHALQRSTLSAGQFPSAAYPGCYRVESRNKQEDYHRKGFVNTALEYNTDVIQSTQCSNVLHLLCFKTLRYVHAIIVCCMLVRLNSGLILMISDTDMYQRDVLKNLAHSV